jgi:hypothetical protein
LAVNFPVTAVRGYATRKRRYIGDIDKFLIDVEDMLLLIAPTIEFAGQSGRHIAVALH